VAVKATELQGAETGVNFQKKINEAQKAASVGQTPAAESLVKIAGVLYNLSSRVTGWAQLWGQGLHGYNNGLQAARALACLCVVIGHASYMASDLTATAVPNWILGNPPQFGVTLFFVLSGYVMGMILRQDSLPSVTRFLWLRALRIYPAYWTAALAFCVLSYFVLWRAVPPFDVTALLLWPLRFGDSTYGVPAWTLVYEAVFYVLIAALIAARASRWHLTTFAIVWTAVILGYCAIYGQPYFHFDPQPYILVSPLNLAFIAGLMVAVHRVALDQVPPPVLLLLALTLWILGWAFEPVPDRLLPTLFQVPACALCIIAFTRLRPGGWIGAVALSIGNASYGIYLVHLIVLDVMHTVAGRYALKPPILITFVAMLAISLAVGWIFGLADFAAYRRMKSAPHTGKTVSAAV
jgi:peptidoglycan/LPS O-acetylase OafA/YrhL